MPRGRTSGGGDRYQDMNDDSMLGSSRPAPGSNPGLPPEIDRPAAPIIPMFSNNAAVGAPGGVNPPTGRSDLSQPPIVPNVRTQNMPTGTNRYPTREERRANWAADNRYTSPAIQPGTDPQDFTHRSRFHPPQGDPNRHQSHFSGPWASGMSRWRPFQRRYASHYDQRHHSYRDPRYRPGMVRFVRDSRVKGGNSGYYQILGNVRRYDERPRGAVQIKGRDGNRYYAVPFRRGDHGFGRWGRHMGGVHHFGRRFGNWFGKSFGGGHHHHGGRSGGGRGGMPPQWDRGGFGRGRGGRGDRDWGHGGGHDWDDDDDHGRGRRRRRRRRRHGRHGGRWGRGRGGWDRGGSGRPWYGRPGRPPSGGMMGGGTGWGPPRWPMAGLV